MNKRYKNAYTLESVIHIEGFERMADSDEKFVIHHRLETHRWSKKQQKWILRDEPIPAKVLKALNLYYNRPASELIFLSSSEHSKLHNSFKKEVSSETKKRISEAAKKQWEHRYATGWSFTEETRKKMSDAKKGKAPHNKGTSGQFHHSDDTKAKISAYQKTHDNAGRFGNRPSWNKGTHESGMKGKHHSEESKRKSSESNKLAWAKRDRTPDIWINNGIINRRIKITEQIPEGFARGRMRK